VCAGTGRAPCVTGITARDIGNRTSRRSRPATYPPPVF
jgi:hypothetical protein